jgi:hypothetical protein
MSLKSLLELYYVIDREIRRLLFQGPSSFFQIETNSLDYKAKRSPEMLSIGTVLVKGRALRRWGSFGICKEKTEGIVGVRKIDTLNQSPVTIQGSKGVYSPLPVIL